MALVIHLLASAPPHSLLLLRKYPSGCIFPRWRRSPWPVYRLEKWNYNCCSANVEIEASVLTEIDKDEQNLESLPAGCSVPTVYPAGDLDSTQSIHSSEYIESHMNAIHEELPLLVLSEKEQYAIAAMPAHPAGLNALYVSYFFGNMVEQLWSFAWPAALAILHPSLLPVALVGFFSKFSVFIGAPIVGKLMDCLPRIPVYATLNTVQVATQLASAAMIIYALKTVCHAPAAAVLFQPWFIALVLAGALERLAGLTLGVAMERDWVVLLAGSNRPVALAQANAILNRLDLLCEAAGASLFGFLLSKYSPVNCLKIVCCLMSCSLPILILLGQAINRLSCNALDRSQNISEIPVGSDLLDFSKAVQNGLASIRHGWNEYKQQTVLPASVATVFLNFNIALAPGAIMTALLMHQGISPSIIGGFSAFCSFMGFAATFISSRMVKRIGILRAGAAGLVFQLFLLSIALVVYSSGITSQKIPLYLFLSSIVLSRLGHMSYDVVGTQILQTGVPASKANLIGSMEVSIASLAELLMLGVAIIANDVSHFGLLAFLSFCSVGGAAWMFCQWLTNPTDQQREFFMFDPQFEAAK